MPRDIGSLGDRDRDQEPLAWQPWQPPVMPPQPPIITEGGEDQGVTGVSGARGRIGGDRLNTGELTAKAMRRHLDQVNLDQLSVPMDPAVIATANALGELGVVNGVAQVASAVARTTFSPDAIGASLGQFSEILANNTSKLMAVPGVGDALQAFGGAAGVAAGALGLKRELDEAKAKGLGPQQALGIASRAAQLVGGVAMALSPLCPALAPVGAVLMTGGAALSLGKLAYESRHDLAAGARKLGQKADRLDRIVSNNGAAMVGAGAPLKAISNHGANEAWKWITG